MLFKRSNARKRFYGCIWTAGIIAALMLAQEVVATDSFTRSPEDLYPQENHPSPSPEERYRDGHDSDDRRGQTNPVLQKYDKDNDGYIDRVEAHDDADLDAKFISIDKNMDGRLSIDEINAYYQKNAH